MILQATSGIGTNAQYYQDSHNKKQPGGLNQHIAAAEPVVGDQTQHDHVQPGMTLEASEMERLVMTDEF